jgi:virginiamycin B lyase
MPGTMKTMSMIRRGVMMGANDTGNMSVWDGSAWKRIPGVLRSMSAAADGTVWGVNGTPGQRDAQGRPVGNQVFRWKIGASNWEGPVAYDMNKVAVGAADQVWGIGTNRHVVVWDVANNRFKPPVMNTDAIDIAGASDGTLWYIGSDHFLYRVDPIAGTSFQPRMDGDFQLDRISIGGGRLIWGVRQGKVYRRERLAGVGNGTWSEVPVPEPFSEVTVSADGAVCGVAASEKIYTFSGT